MKTNRFGEMVLDEDDLCDLVMQGRDLLSMPNVMVDPSVDLERTISAVQDPAGLLLWSFADESERAVAEFDLDRQNHWFMPQQYAKMDIAEHVLALCHNEQELQRCGQELLMFQQRNLFDLLRYLKYFVDVLRANNVIWGVGRGSSTASFVLYKLGVHRINSLYYDLDPAEFLR